jgi:aryl-alcohol dehydrogenase-like predicted oxidoreductase
VSLATRNLGQSRLEVSALSLGSWRTFERISRDAGLAVMKAAQDEGVNFLDDARYDDESGTAPLPTGHSEVVFGELFRAAHWDRDRTVVANKLWWEHWPAENAATELDGSLRRMGFDYVDLIYAERPPTDLNVEEVVGEVTELIAAGKARAWGLLNWNPEQTREAHRVATAQGVAGPVTTQLPYSVVQTSPVEDEPMVAALAATGITIVASYSLAGGVLTGKYDLEPGRGRAVGRLDEDRLARAVLAARQMSTIAHELDVSIVALAFAFVRANPLVDSVLCGATTPEQVRHNASAIRRATHISPETLEALRAISASV